MPKHSGRYNIIVDWHNAVVAEADQAQRLANDGAADRDTKIRVVSDVLKKALIDRWGGGELPDATVSKIDDFARKMVVEGVSSFKRKGEGEFSRKVKKVPDRLEGKRDVSFSDFMKHQYNSAKDAGIISLSSRNAIESEAYGSSDDSAIGSLEKKLAEIFASEPEADYSFPKDLPGLRNIVQIKPVEDRDEIKAPKMPDPHLPPLHKPTAAGIISLRSRSASTIESEAHGSSDDSAIESLQKKAGARLAQILASEPEADSRFPKDLPGLRNVVQIKKPVDSDSIEAPKMLDPHLPPLHKPTMAEKGRR